MMVCMQAGKPPVPRLRYPGAFFFSFVAIRRRTLRARETLQTAGYILASLRSMHVHESCGLGVYDIVARHGIAATPSSAVRQISLDLDYTRLNPLPVSKQEFPPVKSGIQQTPAPGPAEVLR
jgi:hypothetical protein